MDLNKVYYDMEGNAKTIMQMVKLYPEWAANRIQEGEEINAEMLEGYIKLCDEYCIPENLVTCGREGILESEHGWIIKLIEKNTGKTIDEVLK